MAQPMIAIAGIETKPIAKANILPVNISHTGTFPHNEAHWQPTLNENNSQSSYFRGRKMTGCTTKIPETHVGVVVEVVETEADPSAVEEGLEEDIKQPEGKMEIRAKFEEVVIWRQNSAPSTSEDQYSRAMSEWSEVSSKIHSL
ncbi:hypothetical protein CFIMG_000903RA [Ceratocystis fimbriata CBS 114723]|uniref:Uncharacterized protein n=1 Tax=Ceratocystis fimbriata CBS 114723 TaxID=1035309 RepID=A0A2C5XI31_9PEZI|nr:hypothetical protein CFIMG_000903RA [Ceratocystis fimbriata CBS 114723]